MDDQRLLVVGIRQGAELRADDGAFCKTVESGGSRRLHDLDLIDGTVAMNRERHFDAAREIGAELACPGRPDAVPDRCQIEPERPRRCQSPVADTRTLQTEVEV